VLTAHLGSEDGRPGGHAPSPPPPPHHHHHFYWTMLARKD